MSRWKWDQGRLIYFEYNTLKLISTVLVKLNGVSLTLDPDPLRKPLELETGMPFAPSSYRVWRNYKRVFECSFLATSIDNKLVVTDFCYELAKPSGKFVDTDDFLFHYIPRFRFPFAAFKDYNPTDLVVYPFCAVLKLLFSKLISGRVPSLTLEDVFTFLIGNDVTGLEDLDYYEKLKSKSVSPTGDEERQVREMLIFISQLSLLKWHKANLILDLSIVDYTSYNGFTELITPNYLPPKLIREEEFLAMTSLSHVGKLARLQPREMPTDEIFIEGKKSRVTHLKIERSPLLRKMFLSNNPTPICNMCTCNTQKKYPWTSNLIEVHHLLPLSSSLGITSKGTSLTDVIGLCPTCHRSVHLYYNKWLKAKGEDDFKNKTEAIMVYEEAKRQLVA